MHFSYPKHQHGVVLILSLIILSLLTLIAVTGMKTTINQEKMSGNFRNSELSHQAAESALIDAAAFIDAMVSKNQLTNINGLLKSAFDGASNELDYLDDTTWDQGNGNNYTLTNFLGNAQLAQQPRYIIKHIETINICTPPGLWDPDAPSFPECDREIFRVTAHGTGLTQNTTKILQMYYARTRI